MHTKIMLLSGSPRGDALCGYAERLLTDISAAFDHSFSLLRGKIGEKSLAESGELLTEKTVEQCESCQAILMFDAGKEGAMALYDALDMPLRIRSVCVPESLCARHEASMKVWLGIALSLDADTLRRVMQRAFQFAQEEDAHILYIAPTGAAREEWEAAIRVQGASEPQVSADRLSAPDAVSALIRRPHRLGLMLCPPYAGGILEAAASALCPHPEVIHDFAWDGSIGIYAPYLAEEAADQPFSTALAVARLLRASLQLSRESGCLEAAVQNVMSNQASSEPPDQEEPGRSSLDLICDQIAVAGELMGKGGILS